MRGATLCFAVATPIMALAQAGTLDVTFDADGIVTTEVGSSGDFGNAIALQDDGKILVAGYFNSSESNFAIVRYHADGTIDTTFDLDGIVTIDFGSGVYDRACAVEVQSDGKILIGGTAGAFSPSSPDFVVVRLNPDGAFDPSFDLDGIALIDIGGGGDEARDMVLQADGKVIIGGYTSTSSADMAAVRLLPNGSLDNSFGVGGKIISSIPYDDFANALAIQSDGKILLGGLILTLTEIQFAVARYSPNGALDNSFGSAGVVIQDIGIDSEACTAIALQPDGKILAAGGVGDGSNNQFAVVRLNPDGSPDTGFSSDGVVTTVIGISDYLADILIQPDGMILACGQSYGGGPEDFALVRYESNGTLDNSFGSNGIVTTDIQGSMDGAEALVMQADGKIVVAGSGITSGYHEIALARYFSGLESGVVEYSGSGLGATCITPNPLSDNAMLSYEMTVADEVSCTLMDVQGNLVRVFIRNDFRTLGPHYEVLDLSGVAAGHYTLVLGNGHGKVSVGVVKE